MPSPADDNGWELCDGNLSIKWMEMPPASKSVLEYVNCACKKSCTSGRCSCLRANLKCTGLCKCNQCKNCEELDELSGESGSNYAYESDDEDDD